MTFQDHSLKIAYRLGTYQALAGMLRDAANDLAQAQDDHDREWATKRLAMLVEQYDEAHERYTAEEAVA